MPTLSIVKMDFGKGLKWGGIILGIAILLFIVLKFLFFVKELILPSAPPPPTVSFGKLPASYFPEGVKKDFTYEIDTLSAELPVLNVSEKVYKMEQRGPDILAVENASKKVASLGFRSRPQQISDFIYKWDNPNPPVQNLVLNIELSEFNLSSSYLSYEDKLKGDNFTSESEPIGAATAFLKTLDFLPDDIDEEKTKVEFLTLDGGVVNPTTRTVNSNIADVYFFQKDRDELPIVYPQANKSSMKMTVGAGSLKGKILDGKFSHQNILDETATYPIKTAEEAFEDLKNGNAYIAAHSTDNTNIKIKNIYTALYYEGQIQQYLTPVIVFEGDNDFVAYVPAIKADWIDN